MQYSNILVCLINYLNFYFLDFMFFFNWSPLKCKIQVSPCLKFISNRVFEHDASRIQRSVGV
jgi:hypothetical protein